MLERCAAAAVASVARASPHDRLPFVAATCTMATAASKAAQREGIAE
jgi:hypothetical protein